MVVLVSGVLAIGIGFYRLPSGWVEPAFQKAFSDVVGPLHVTIPKVQVRWGGWRHPLGIRIGQVSLLKEENQLKLEIPKLLFSLEIVPLLTGQVEIGKCIFSSVKIYLKDHVVGQISGKVKKRNDVVSLKATFQNVDVVALSHMFMDKSYLTQDPFPVSGNIELEGGGKKGLSKINLVCKTNNGSLLLPPFYPQPISLNAVELSLGGDHKTLVLKSMCFKYGDANLTIQGKIQAPISWETLYQKGGDVSFSLQGNGDSISFDDLHLLWPQGLNPASRVWVTHNLSEGIAEAASMVMEGTIHADPKGHVNHVHIPEVKGSIHVKDMKVRYFGDLPPVTNVQGICDFTREQFLIHVKGQVHDIHMTEGHIVIDGLHLEDQDIDIRLVLDGPLRKSLEVIDRQPLGFAKKLGLNSDHLSGHAYTKLDLTFPLKTDLSLDLVQVKAQSKITEGKMIYDTQIKGKPIILDQGIFRLDVNKKSLSMKGTGCLQEVPMNFEWQEYFPNTQVPFRRQLALRGALDLKKLNHFGLDLSDYLSGEASSILRYTVQPNGQEVIEGEADLTKAIMLSPVLPWQKEKGEKARLKLRSFRKSPHQALIFQEIFLEAPSLHLKMTGKMTKEEEFFEFSPLIMGKSQLEGTLQKRGHESLQVTVKGKMLDLSHMLEDSSSEPLVKPQQRQQETNIPFHVHLSLDHVGLGHKGILQHVKGDMTYNQDGLGTAKIQGKTPKGADVSFDMSPLSATQQSFVLQSHEGGYLLEMLGAGYDIEGGNLKIQGVKTLEEQNQEADEKKSWKIAGNITLDDFTINKAPLLARLLSAASLQGIVNIFSGQVHFYEGTADFTLTPQMLALQKVRLISPSIGLLFDGNIDQRHQTVNFKGELVPLYMINALLAKIPILGSWISGGRSDGIFMTQFTLTGNRQDPHLMINPLTTVTPGLMREFFTAPQENAPIAQ